DAYASPSMTSIRHHRWSSSSRLLFSTAAASGADVASSPSGSTTAIKAESSTSTTTLTTPITPTTISEENITTRDLLSLDYIRSTLIRQEETIIFALIERAQFRLNDVVYKVGGVPGLGVPPGSSSINSSPKSADGDGEEEQQEKLSFLDFMFIGTEALHSIVRRYESPEEHAFFPSRLPKRSNSLAELEYPDLLSNDNAINQLNWNKILYEKYLNVVLPAITEKGDDEQYGSTVLADIAALQALSKRIHYGKFVAESKYRSNPTGFQQLVDDGDAEGVMKLLTNSAVEEQVLTRARLKARTYGREPSMSVTTNGEGGDCAAAKDEENEEEGKVDPLIIESIYRQLIIPMTKDIEVAYLFLRCGREPPAEFASDRMSVDVTELSPR
ncbi:hypothetical protein ACHAWU_004104, partial [Discostella pseudostelligera]